MLINLDFLKPGEFWPPKCEEERLKEYADNLKLFQCKHNEVFKDWARLLREDMKASLLIVLNWHKRLSLLWADMLLGEPPRIRVGGVESKKKPDPKEVAEPQYDSPEEDALERIMTDNQLIQTAYAVAVDISRFGTGIFKLRYKDRGIIEGQPPNVWFPVVAPDNLKDVSCHVLAWSFKEGPNTYLKAEIHERGKLTHRLFKLKDFPVEKVMKIEKEINLNFLDRYKDLAPVEETGIDDFLIIPIAGVVTTDQPQGIGPDDYRDIESVMQELMVRFSQISRILDKHSDPNMSGPDTAISNDPWYGRPEVVGGGKYFPVGIGDVEPKYIVWDSQLTAAYEEIDRLIAQLYVLSETSPAAFGQLEQGMAESGSALRRLMLAPLAKVNRVRLNLDPAFKKALILTSQLEVNNGMPEAVELEDVDIHWRDGLPEDMTEAVNNENVAISASITSRESAIKRVYGLEGEALKEELDRIDAEKQASMDMIAPPDQKPDPKLPTDAGKTGGNAG